MGAFDCRHCGRLIDSWRIARCPYCYAPMCAAMLRDCEAAHIDLRHPRSGVAKDRELDQAFPPEEP